MTEDSQIGDILDGLPDIKFDADEGHQNDLMRIAENNLSHEKR